MMIMMRNLIIGGIRTPTRKRGIGIGVLDMLRESILSYRIVQCSASGDHSRSPTVRTKNSEFPLLTQKPSLTEPQNIPPTVDATILVWGNGDLDLEKEGW